LTLASSLSIGDRGHKATYMLVKINYSRYRICTLHNVTNDRQLHSKFDRYRKATFSTKF